MTANSPVRVLRDMADILADAAQQAQLGYEFAPNSYTHSCLSACLAAERALDVLREALADLRTEEENT